VFSKACFSHKLVYVIISIFSKNLLLGNNWTNWTKVRGYLHSKSLSKRSMRKLRRRAWWKGKERRIIPNRRNGINTKSIRSSIERLHDCSYYYFWLFMSNAKMLNIRQTPPQILSEAAPRGYSWRGSRMCLWDFCDSKG
jgi:hypothetical protein